MRRGHPRCNGQITLAPLWVAYTENIVTLARTAATRVPRSVCVHWVRDREVWLRRQRAERARILAVELADGATRLGDLAAATVPTVVLLGHEHHGVAEDVWTLVDEVVEIPMVGMGSSLNVAVAGSLVAYRLAGMF